VTGNGSEVFLLPDALKDYFIRYKYSIKGEFLILGYL
jgi:hypothetical protein